MHDSTPLDQLHSLFQAQQQASRAQPEVDLATRRDRLLRLQALLEEGGRELADAVHEDFGSRSPALTDVADMFVLRSMLRHTLRALPRWTRTRRVATPWYLWPGRAALLPQPLGVVGVISPWNYPLQLALGPALTALAAGNRVLLKPSELVPRTSVLLARLVGRHFAPEEFAVVQGDAALAAAFSALPFDHLLFTGSTAAGRKVAQAAAANLTPVTLELGGKSPCIIDTSCDLADAALKIAHGKLLNAGQTCIAPDYVLLPAGMEEAFAAAIAQASKRLYPAGFDGNPDYASIINERHLLRLQRLMEQAAGEGARVLPFVPGATPVNDKRQMAPTLVLNASMDTPLMREEIFGPILPVLPYRKLQEAIALVNAAPRPLALYWFGHDRERLRMVLGQTLSGGVTVNDTLLHIAHENLPFGGIGDSGMGAYHGEEGFRRFSHMKPVFAQSRLAPSGVFYPPYGKRHKLILRLLGMGSG